MVLHQSHPQYSPALELLCLLPIEHTPAKLSDVAEDLRMSQPHVRQGLSDQLGEFGIEVVKSRGRGGGIGISARSWLKAQRIGEEYMRRVYDSHPSVASTDAP